MIFNSLAFVVFFLCLFPVYYLCRGLALRQWILLLGSFFFYGWWDWRFLLLMGGVILSSYGATWLFERFPGRKKLTLVGCLALQLSVLGFFKYFHFFVDNLIAMGRLLGVNMHPASLRIILPVGISFYTFQAISYVVDVYRGDLPQERNLRKVALYIAFFPHLVAGPIVRAAFFIPQLDREVRLNTRDLAVGIRLFLMGLIYKVVFADRIAEYVDVIYSGMAKYDNLSVWMGALGFYGQIYFDFVGYSTMAIGIARLFGYRLCDNFDFPYVSRSVTEFWRRWHMSLSHWLRDYLYIPLGGNRFGFIMQNRNLMLTMLLGGLWHGASWNFVLWGGLHGGALVAHKLLVRFRKARGWEANPAAWWHRLGVYPLAAWAGTQLFVLLCWVPFRLPAFSETLTALKALLGLRPDAGLMRTTMPGVLFLPIAADILLLSRSKKTDAGEEIAGLPVYWRFAMFGLVLALTLFLSPLKVKNFIYFQF